LLFAREPPTTPVQRLFRIGLFGCTALAIPAVWLLKLVFRRRSS
jgi:hypothetical protein